MLRRTLLLWLGVLVLSLFVLAPLPVALAESGHQTGVVATANYNLTMRSGPGQSYAPTGTVIPSGTVVPVLGKDASSTWLFVEYSGSRGWVAAWLTTITGGISNVPVTNEGGSQPPPSGPTPTPIPGGGGGGVTATPRSGQVNMRSGPGTSYSIVGRVPAGVAVPVVGRNSASTWLQVEYNGVRGWVAAYLCTISGDLNSVPVVQTGGSGGGGGGLPPLPGASGFSLGGQVPGYISNPTEMRRADMTWVKFQVVWVPGMDPNMVRGMIDSAHSQGFRVLLSVKGILYPSNIDYGSYVNFVGAVAAMGADAIEIWNEQNLDREWPAGQINPSAYVNYMLAPSYQAIKAANPNTLVIAGAPAPTGVHTVTTVWADDVYIAGMRDAGAANFMDCLGIHYNAGATSPDATSGHPADSGARHYSWYFRPMVNLYSGVFPNTRLCFTELGYLSPDGFVGLPPNFWWGYGTSVSEHATWLGRAVTLARTGRRTTLVIIFNVGFTYYGDDPQGGYSIIRPDGSCPACSRLAAAIP